MPEMTASIGLLMQHTDDEQLVDARNIENAVATMREAPQAGSDALYEREAERVIRKVSDPLA